MLKIYNGIILTPQGLKKGEVWCHRGTIVPPQARYEKAVNAQGCIVAPGYIDLQINGAYGVDFTAHPERVGEAARQLPRNGITSFLPTLISSSRKEYTRLIHLLQPRPISGGASILGIHLEGPFFNPELFGAHDPKCSAALTDQADLHTFYGSLSGVKMITFAPEQPYMLEAISKLKEHNIILALGHSAASFQTILQAVERGASVVTHLFNRMLRFDHRMPGLIDAALIEPCMNYTLICDGIHLHEHAIKLAWKMNPKGLILVSDATGAMGLPQGLHMLAKQKIEVSGRGSYLEGTNTLAGSVVGIDAAVRHLRSVTGCGIAEAIETATLRPAKLLGIEGRKGTLSVGADADFILLDQALNVRGTYVLGQRLL